MNIPLSIDSQASISLIGPSFDLWLPFLCDLHVQCSHKDSHIFSTHSTFIYSQKIFRYNTAHGTSSVTLTSTILAGKLRGIETGSKWNKEVVRGMCSKASCSRASCNVTSKRESDEKYNIIKFSIKCNLLRKVPILVILILN